MFNIFTFWLNYTWTHWKKTKRTKASYLFSLCHIYATLNESKMLRCHFNKCTYRSSQKVWTPCIFGVSEPPLPLHSLVLTSVQLLNNNCTEFLFCLEFSLKRSQTFGHCCFLWPVSPPRPSLCSLSSSILQSPLRHGSTALCISSNHLCETQCAAYIYMD